MLNVTESSKECVALRTGSIGVDAAGVHLDDHLTLDSALVNKLVYILLSLFASYLVDSELP